jgi:hypothetical protein
MTWEGLGIQFQKFLAELFFKKATAFCSASRQVVDAGLRRHDDGGV